MNNELDSVNVDSALATNVVGAATDDNHDGEAVSEDSTMGTDTSSMVPTSDTDSQPLLKIIDAYNKLAQKSASNQEIIHQNRVRIADLRAQMRELVADIAFDEGNDEHDLHNNKVAVQEDSCANIISHAEMIREKIYHNSAEAQALLAPIKYRVALLELRIQYIRAIEELLLNVKNGMTLQDQLLDIDVDVEALLAKINKLA